MIGVRNRSVVAAATLLAAPLPVGAQADAPCLADPFPSEYKAPPPDDMLFRGATILDGAGGRINLPATFDQLGARQDSAAILARTGVPIAFGLAGGPIHMTYNAGLGLREGAGLAVPNGLSYPEALRALTVNPLAIWGDGGGRLAPGSDADLVIWDGDPLEASTNAAHVIVEGKLVPTVTRQDLLARRYRDSAK